MAYIDVQNAFTMGAEPVTFAPRLESSEKAASLSALEWLVVAMAERDRPSSLRAPNRLSLMLGVLFGSRRSAGLANPGLEALRRLAVLLWRHGRGFDGVEIPTFLAAGYSPAQFELVAASIEAARARRQQRPAHEHV